MSDTVIIVENLSKSYLVGHQSVSQGHIRYTALRDVIADPQHRAQCRQYGARATGCSRRSGGGVLGPKGCELRGQARRGIGDYRAVGDAEFQRKCIGKMQNIATGEGRTVFFVSHNLPAIVNLCTSAICLNDGKIVQIGEPNVVCAGYAVLRNTALKSRNSSDILEEILLLNTANQPSLI